jgi:hypothetical protein
LPKTQAGPATSAPAITQSLRRGRQAAALSAAYECHPWSGGRSRDRAVANRFVYAFRSPFTIRLTWRPARIARAEDQRAHRAGSHRSPASRQGEMPGSGLLCVAAWPGPGFPGNRRKLTLASREIEPKVSFLPPSRTHTCGHERTLVRGRYGAGQSMNWASLRSIACPSSTWNTARAAGAS